MDHRDYLAIPGDAAARGQLALEGRLDERHVARDAGHRVEQLLAALDAAHGGCGKASAGCGHACAGGLDHGRQLHGDSRLDLPRGAAHARRGLEAGLGGQRLELHLVRRLAHHVGVDHAEGDTRRERAVPRGESDEPEIRAGHDRRDLEALGGALDGGAIAGTVLAGVGDRDHARACARVQRIAVAARDRQPGAIAGATQGAHGGEHAVGGRVFGDQQAVVGSAHSRLG